MRLPPMVFISGMAHSGTTALAQFLGLTPGYSLHVSSARLEADELIRRDAGAIRRVARESRGVFVMKAPWLEQDAAWCAQEFPEAHYLIMLRNFAAVEQSWIRDMEYFPTLADRCSTFQGRVELYAAFCRYAEAMVRAFPKACIVEHSLLCKSRGMCLAPILQAWNLPPPQFDSGVIDSTKA